MQTSRTQFENIPPNAQKTRVIIGLDFGTAFTKVVVSGRRQKYGVPLRPESNGVEQYLLPTSLCIDSNGSCSVGASTNGVRHHRDLKMKILLNELDADTKIYIIIYLAIVLQRVRHWLLIEKRAVFDNSELVWSVNVGLPTEKNDALQDIYCDLVDKAWYISTQAGPLVESRIRQEIESYRQNSARGLHPDLIKAFPEFVAQVKGYVDSSQHRINVVHLLVDVGAGTIDTTVFNTHEHEEEYRHAILAESVENLGTTFLIHRRYDAMGIDKLQFAIGENVPSNYDFAEQHNITLEELNKLDQGFSGKISAQIDSQCRQAKEAAPIQKEWKEGVPFILCGGGGQVDFYKKIASNMTKGKAHYCLQEIQLPALKSLDAPGIMGTHEHRLSVAYGLSYDALNIAEISRPSPTSAQSSQVTVSCPVCGGGGGGYGNCLRCGGSGSIVVNP